MAVYDKDRRKSKDIWTYGARILAILGWTFFIIAMVVSYYAAPEKNYGLLRYHNIEVRQAWVTPLTDYLYIVLWLSALSSYFCLLLDKYRSRRKNDSKHFNALLLLCVSVAWAAYIYMQLSMT